MRSAPRRPATTIAIAALVVAGTGTAVAAARPSAPATVASPVTMPSWLGATTHGATTTLNRTILAGLAKATKVGAADPSTVLSVTIALAHPDAAGEAALAQAIYDPSSPQFHHYLTPAQYDARFGVPAARTQATVAWLKAAGAEVTQVLPGGDYINLHASVKTLAKLLDVSFGSFRSEGTTFVANTVAPTVPTRLGIETVVGLNTVEKATPTLAHRVGAPRPNVLGLTPNGPFTPQDMWSVYDLPATNRGSGATAGVFMEGQTASVISDLRVFESHFNLPKVPVRVVTEGKPGVPTDNLGNEEWAIDGQAISGMAPDMAELDYYTAQTFLDADLLPVFAQWRDDPKGPLQMNASFGECEQSPVSPVEAAVPTVNNLSFGLGLGNVTEPQYEGVLRAAAMEGRTLFSSTGDTGSGCPSVALPGVGGLNGANAEPIPLKNYPGSSPWAVAVGGTDIETTDATFTKRSLEYVEPTAGGGASAFLAAQPWMASVAAMKLRVCPLDETGAVRANPLTECRGTPDVAALYGGQTGAGYDVFGNHVEIPGGGTSLSSPLTVGMWTRIQAAAPTAAGLGFAQPVIYKLGTGATAKQDFYDVTVGAIAGTDPTTLTALPGWDFATGFGVIDGAHFMQDATGRLTPARPHAQAAVALPTTNACLPLFTTFQGNANDALGVPSFTKDPSVDITKGTVSTTADGSSLVITLSGPTLSPKLDTNLLPFGADLNLIWLYDGKLYYAKASVAQLTGKVSYEAGFLDGNPASFTSKGAITGTFADHTVTMTVPRTLVGSPPVGARLQYPIGLVESAELGPVFLAIGLDTGAGQDYIVGSACKTGTTVIKKPVKHPTKKPVKKPTVTAPGGALAATGLPIGLAVVAVLTTGAGLLVRRRTATRD